MHWLSQSLSHSCFLPIPTATTLILHYATLTPYLITALPFSVEDLTSFTEKLETFFQEALQIAALNSSRWLIYTIFNSFVNLAPPPHSLDKYLLRAFYQPDKSTADTVLSRHSPCAQSASNLVRNTNNQKDTDKSYQGNQNLILMLRVEVLGRVSWEEGKAYIIPQGITSS